MLLLTVASTGCYKQTQARISATGTLELANERWQRKPGDTARFEHQRSGWSPSVRLEHLYSGRGWVCTPTNIAIADVVMGIRIRHVDEERLAGALAGITNPFGLEKSEDGGFELVVSPEEVRA